ncbi:unnamed protein product [Strongylus vulgaris]|uniref:Uncharacterized protein n=1 Tax=Strongylus vulgaris TaxID=40348 RepID=A0A3P7JQW0_STRVU|nr:unnamed protein product [Strongylus vulgaris]
MDYENMPIDFSSHSSYCKKSSTFQVRVCLPAVVYHPIPHAFKNLDMEMDDLVIEESLHIQTTNMICSKNEELEVKDVLSNSIKTLRRGLSDVTNRSEIFDISAPGFVQRSHQNPENRFLLSRNYCVQIACITIGKDVSLHIVWTIRELSNMFRIFYYHKHYNYNEKEIIVDASSSILLCARSQQPSSSPPAPRCGP